MEITFDPSRGLYGYTDLQMKDLLSMFTNNRVRLSSAGHNYLVLAQRAIVAAQRWNNIPFTDDQPIHRLSLPLNFYEHYIPGSIYSQAELELFYKHYGVKTIRGLDEAHVWLESRYPLDPSFVRLANHLRTSASIDVISYLCKLFGLRGRSALFDRYYRLHSDLRLDPDVNLTVLLEEPERLLSTEQPLLLPNFTRKIEQAASSPSIIQRAYEKGLVTEDKSSIELLLELGETLPPDAENYIQYLQERRLVADGSIVSMALESTEPLSAERMNILHDFDTEQLQSYTSRHQIVIIDPISQLSHREDIITALAFLTVE